jgi:hypothetical protein
MDDIMDPALAQKIECFMSRKREKYHLFDAARPRWNGYEYIPRKKWMNKRASHNEMGDIAWGL